MIGKYFARGFILICMTALLSFNYVYRILHHEIPLHKMILEATLTK